MECITIVYAKPGGSRDFNINDFKRLITSLSAKDIPFTLPSLWHVRSLHINNEKFTLNQMKKKIGIVGGLSPESTANYYLYITSTYADRFGNYDYPEIIIYSVNLENYHQWRSLDRWDLIIDDIASCFQKLKNAGADFGLIATNTMHKAFRQVADIVDLPLINIIDETALKAKELGISTIGLLGTKYTMSDGFYQERLSKFDIHTLVPNPDQQEVVHKIIVDELVRGHFLEKSKNR